MPRPRVLVVDDDYSFAEFAKLLLESMGCEAEVALSGSRGLELAAARPPDLVLMDLSMPQMGGLEATRLLKAEPATAAVPVIVCSIALERADEEAALLAGAASCLRKPLGAERLRAEVERALGPR